MFPNRFNMPPPGNNFMGNHPAGGFNNFNNSNQGFGNQFNRPPPPFIQPRFNNQNMNAGFNNQGPGFNNRPQFNPAMRPPFIQGPNNQEFNQNMPGFHSNQEMNFRGNNNSNFNGPVGNFKRFDNEPQGFSENISEDYGHQDSENSYRDEGSMNRFDEAARYGHEESTNRFDGNSGSRFDNRGPGQQVREQIQGGSYNNSDNRFSKEHSGNGNRFSSEDSNNKFDSDMRESQFTADSSGNRFDNSSSSARYNEDVSHSKYENEKGSRFSMEDSSSRFDSKNSGNRFSTQNYDDSREDKIENSGKRFDSENAGKRYESETRYNTEKSGTEKRRSRFDTDQSGNLHFPERDDKSGITLFQDQDDKSGNTLFQDQDDKSGNRNFKEQDDKSGIRNFQDQDDKYGSDYADRSYKRDREYSNNYDSGSDRYDRSEDHYDKSEDRYSKSEDRYSKSEDRYSKSEDKDRHDKKSDRRSEKYDYRDRDSTSYDDRERERDRSNRRSRDSRDDKRKSDYSSRGRDRDYDRSRDRKDHRDRSRDKDRSRDRYDKDSRSSSPEDDRYSNSKDDRSTDRFQSEKATSTILLRGVPTDCDEAYIIKKVNSCGISPRDVRIIRRRSTGLARGFAYVEFKSTDEAQQWMEATKGRITLLDQAVTLHYSIPKGSPPNNFQAARCDWICKKCGAHNFRRRDVCFKCALSREESDNVQTGEGFDEVGINPCNTLIFRGLDALTTEETLVHALTTLTMTIKNVRIMRDKATSTSRGYGFVEFNSVAEAAKILENLTTSKSAFEVDGKLIIVAYAKNTFSTVMMTQNQYMAQADSKPGYSTPSQHSDQQYDYNHSQYYNTQHTGSVAKSAIEQAHAAQSLHQDSQYDYSQVDLSQYPKYPPPDVSTYQYEESSGYYYDPLTTLYYDANTQYYYNSQTQKFMYWDAANSTYLPAPPDSQNNDSQNKDKEPEQKTDKVKIAKKVAKEMEKWAKTLNTKKDSKRSSAFSQSMGSFGGRESATADAGFAMLTKKAEDKKLMPPPPLLGGAAGKETKSLLVASYGGDSDEEEEEDNTSPDESKLIDWTKLACLLCKRQFNSKDILTKHVQMSDLHKQNVEKWKQDNQPKAEAAQQPLQYRDRAKERRDKFGVGHPPGRKHSFNMFAETEPKKTQSPPPLEGGKGSKLMGKMGWSSGQGLGKSNQGRLDIVTVTKRASAAGLGARGSSYGVDASASYHDSIKQAMQYRYNECE